MTSFVHVDYPTEHPGVARAERLVSKFNSVVKNLDGDRASASMLLAALVAALMVVANQVIDTWTEGHLLAAWIVMWTVAFAALALFATPVRRAVTTLRKSFKARKAAYRERVADEKLWAVALTDARVMADISRAMEATSRTVKKGYRHHPLYRTGY